MPCDYKRYPADWKEIRARILARAGNACEKCGVPNGHHIHRSLDGRFWFDAERDCFVSEDGEQMSEPFERVVTNNPTRIVLTIAHMDRPGDVCQCVEKCGIEEHLRAWCQRCHLLYDLPKHQANARHTRHAKKAAGSLFGVAT